MQWLYQNYKRAEKLYDFSDIAAAIRSTSGLDYQPFFARYIEGTDTIPVAEYFDLGKALWDFEFTPDAHSKHGNLYHSLGVWPER